MRYKHIVFSVISISLTIATAKFCKSKTAGFTICKVQDNFDLSESKNEEIIPPEIVTLLDQPYSYLAKGKQSFVFASEDGKYVLKLFTDHYQRKVHFFSLLSHIPFFTKWAEGKIEYNKYKLHATFESYSIALNKLKEETGILYVHTSPKQYSPLLIHIIDRLGIRHKIPIKKSAFLIQKRAEPFYTNLLSLKQKGDDQTAKVLIDSLFNLLIARFNKGIFDKDPLLRSNFGFIDSQAVEFDVGSFSENPTMKDPAVYTQEIVKITTNLRRWLEINYTELLPELENQYQSKLKLEPIN